MAKFIWNKGSVPSGIKITQVYGIIFDEYGRILLKIEDDKYSFAGGTPEDFDLSLEDTLIRELKEEINTSIYDPIIVGYQLVDEENGIKPYAQVRMAARIKFVGPKLPDPDNFKIYRRILVNPNKAIELLNWGEIAKLQIYDALSIMNISQNNKEDEEV